jgi:hypothetical protein
MQQSTPDYDLEFFKSTVSATLHYQNTEEKIYMVKEKTFLFILKEKQS